MRYGIDVESFGTGRSEKIEVSVSRLEESRRYRNRFEERKKASAIPMDYLKHIEFSLDTEDPRVATHFVAKTIDRMGEIEADKSSFSLTKTFVLRSSHNSFEMSLNMLSSLKHPRS